jgi:hypothetical protein
MRSEGEGSDVRRCPHHGIGGFWDPPFGEPTTVTGVSWSMRMNPRRSGPSDPARLGPLTFLIR